jgi:DNA-binding CsgD family transcriptional regulator
MYHFYYFFNILIIFTGLITVYYQLSLYRKHNGRFLLAYTSFNTSVTFTILFILFANYLILFYGERGTIVIGKHLSAAEYNPVAAALQAGRIFFYSILAANLIWLVSTILSKKVSRVIIVFFAIVVTIYIAIEILLLSRINMSGSLTVLYYLTNYFVITMYIISIAALLFLYFNYSKIAELRRAELAKYAGIAYLTLYIILLSGRFMSPDQNRYVASFAFLGLTVVPFILLAKYFSANKGKNSFFDNFNVSKREQEIILLILEGKSNKEIEEKLFISQNTVKNHIYNIFQKVGVNSRSQLFSLFRKFESVKE